MFFFCTKHRFSVRKYLTDCLNRSDTEMTISPAALLRTVAAVDLASNWGWPDWAAKCEVHKFTVTSLNLVRNLMFPVCMSTCALLICIACIYRLKTTYSRLARLASGNVRRPPVVYFSLQWGASPVIATDRSTSCTTKTKIPSKIKHARNTSKSPVQGR